MASSNVTTSGTSLVLNLVLTFKPSFAGVKTIYMDAGGSGGSSGWPARGTWTVPSSPVVSAVSVVPASGSGAQQTFSLQYSDSAGFADFSTTWVWFTASFGGNTANACLLYYNRPINTLYLITDGGYYWLPGATPGSATTLGNSQCTVDMASSSVTTSGTGLVLNLALTFKLSFGGLKNVYMDANGSSGTSGWLARGNWTVP
jgi:hypothetical protein